MSARDALNPELLEHPALDTLARFGRRLREVPLGHEQRCHLFASLRVFFKRVPTGILALAMRVSDEWEEYEPLEGTAKGAYILFADVDEYGLQRQHETLLPTHHQMFRQLVGALGHPLAELDDPAYVVPAAEELARKFTHYYRHAAISEGLGLHVASEITSAREFVLLLKGFQAHWQHYGLRGREDPMLEFFRLHTVIEPKHRDHGWHLIDLYVERDPASLAGVRQGALTFLDSFGDLFAQLHGRLF